MTARFSAAIFALLLLWLALPLGALAQALPQELVHRIGIAAEQGRVHEAALSDIIDERRRGANRQLETVVIAAINERPDLYQSIMQEAHRQAPESRARLNITVANLFPGFAGTLRSSAHPPAPVAPPARAEPPAATGEQPPTLVPRDARAPAIEISPPIDQRPEDWPILPREGGADDYADKDPLEGLNRIFFYTNGVLDFLIFELLADGYRYITPEAARIAIRRAFDNLSLPIVFANDLLQFRFHRAATTFSRFAINSTVGILGLFDVAADLGLKPHRANFGQTLHAYGVGDGIYLVLPLFGPTTVRDAIGLGVDNLFDPRTWFLDATTRFALFAGEGISRREELIDSVDFLVEYADSPYDAVRAWTYQQREIELRGD